MKLYSCKVRLAGSLVNEVPRTDVTAAEIMMLQYIHGGPDAVAAIEETGEVRRSHEEERDRLRHAYASAIAKTERGQMDPIMRLFGPDHLPLPLAVKSAPTAPVIPADQLDSLIT